MSKNEDYAIFESKIFSVIKQNIKWKKFFTIYEGKLRRKIGKLVFLCVFLI